MLGEELLAIGYPIISQCLSDLIVFSDIDEDLIRIKMILKDNLVIYIQYNDNDEYSYVILFSLERFDRIRFDNYDKLWDVHSKPHHCHPRYSHPAIESKFVGNPKVDMPLLCEMIKKRSIFSLSGYFEKEN